MMTAPMTMTKEALPTNQRSTSSFKSAAAKVSPNKSSVKPITTGQPRVCPRSAGQIDAHREDEDFQRGPPNVLNDLPQRHYFCRSKIASVMRTV